MKVFVLICISILSYQAYCINIKRATQNNNTGSPLQANVKRRSKVQRFRQALNITTSDRTTTENNSTKVLKQNIAYGPSNDALKEQNESQVNGEKKTNFENAQKKVEIKAKSLDNKGMSAIVVIGNRTHRVSGPVVKELLSELQKQNEDEEKSKKSIDNNQIGQSGSTNLRRIYAANEVAEINRLLGKPLTDAKALGLIKNLLLDRVHTHLAKTMETNQIFDPSQPDASNAVGNNAMSKDALHPPPELCHDQDPKEKCLYLKDLGLCNEYGSHPHIRKRCAETCSLCSSPTPPSPPLLTPSLSSSTVPPNIPPCTEECDEATVCTGCTAATAKIAAPPAPSITQPSFVAPPTTSHPCPISCGGRKPVHTPVDEIQVGPTNSPCPTTCPNHHHFTTSYPVIIRRTTPHPVVVMADNTPVPHVHVPLMNPSLPPPPRIDQGIECAEQIDLIAIPHRRPTTRPTLCPPVVKPVTLCPQSGRHTTLCPPRPTPLCSHIGRHTTLCPLHPTTLCPPVFGRRTTLCPPVRPSITGMAIAEMHTTLRPYLDSRSTPFVHSSTFPPVFHHRTTMPPILPHTPSHLPIGLPVAGILGQVPINGKCSQAMDIGLAVDSSAAVVPHWFQVQQFLKQLVDKFQMNGVSRIGLIQFDTIAKMPVRLDSCPDAACLKQHIMKLAPDRYGKRRTDAALDMARDKLFAQGRSGIPKMLFVLEHGKINGGDPSINWGQMLVEPAQKLKDMGVNVFAIGATPIATLDELKTITSTSESSHYLPLQSYGQLPGAVPQIARKACEIAGPPTLGSLANALDECANCETCSRCAKFEALRRLHPPTRL